MSSSLDNFTEGLNNALEPTLEDLKYDYFTNRVIKGYREYVENTPEEIQEMLNAPQDPSVLHKYSSMSYIEMWEHGAKEMSEMMIATYSFCTTIPGFRDCYKRREYTRVVPPCLYELIVVGMARLINLEKDEILFGKDVLPMSLIAQPRGCHPDELALVVATLEAAKTIAAFQLNDLEIALYQSIVMSYPGVEGLEDLRLLPQLQVVLIENIEMAFEKYHGHIAKELMETLMNMIPKLRELGVMHKQVLRRFEEAHPEHRFPNSAYQEVFCNEELYRDPPIVIDD